MNQYGGIILTQLEDVRTVNMESDGVVRFRRRVRIHKIGNPGNVFINPFLRHFHLAL